MYLCIYIHIHIHIHIHTHSRECLGDKKDAATRQPANTATTTASPAQNDKGSLAARTAATAASPQGFVAEHVPLPAWEAPRRSR